MAVQPELAEIRGRTTHQDRLLGSWYRAEVFIDGDTKGTESEFVNGKRL